MNTPESGWQIAGKNGLELCVLGGLAVTLLLPPRAKSQQNQQAAPPTQHHSIGFIASDEAGSQEVGLPIYPGAKPHKDHSDDTPATQLGLWGANSGFKLVVLKMETPDPSDKVSAFYRRALAKYGKVLSCSQTPSSPGSSEALEASDHNQAEPIDCGDDHPNPGEMELKSGSKEYQHIVGIEPRGHGTVFQLIYVEMRGMTNNKSGQQK